MRVPGTALVTGPTSGIGEAFARLLASKGHDLVLVARDEDRLAALAESLSSAHGVTVEVLPADLSDREQLSVVEQRLLDRDLPIAVLVNNAGFGVKARFTRGEISDEQRMVDVLVIAVMRLSHAAAVSMGERGEGAIVNVSSVASWLTGSTYSAAKAWVTVFSEGLAGEVAPLGVSVTAVCPGYVHTEFHERADMNMGSVPGWMWLDADRVAAKAMRDVDRGKVLSVTGSQYKAMGVLLRHSPRALVRRIGNAR
jgi:short-subunit dehydrogenase